MHHERTMTSAVSMLFTTETVGSRLCAKLLIKGQFISCLSGHFARQFFDSAHYQLARWIAVTSQQLVRKKDLQNVLKNESWPTDIHQLVIAVDEYQSASLPGRNASLLQQRFNRNGVAVGVWSPSFTTTSIAHTQRMS